MQTSQRLYAMDNIRTLMVLCIVLLHACCAYAPSLFWWHARDEGNLLYDLTILGLDTFCLPVLFFIAGLFAQPSYDRHGCSTFLKSKFLRLGGPVVLLAIFYMPTMVYQGYLRRTPAPESFFNYWTHWMSFLADWKYVVINTLAQVQRYQDSLSPHPLWFMSMLLIFFLLYAAVRQMGLGLKSASRPAWLLFAAACLCMALGFGIINSLYQVQTWAKLGPFILFQPTRVPIYAMSFVLGVLLRPNFFSAQNKSAALPGPTWGWLVVFVGALLALFATATAFLQVHGPAPFLTGTTHGLLRSFTALAAIVLFSRLGIRLLNGHSRWRQSLAASSYSIYILHMPLVVFVQIALTGLPLPPLLKMSLAFALPTALCWLWSRTTARRPFWISLAALGVYFIGYSLLF
ncbi:MAG: acyltransferase family protein [Desulfovibrio sp.]|uniref:acyltransferase family protein n=1 Tax=Desulfovibrio sp. 7SRBS1 TaxID=3378064 RepID=UPI003B3CB2A1